MEQRCGCEIVLTMQCSVDDVIYFRQSNAALMLECIVDGVMQR